MSRQRSNGRRPGNVSPALFYIFAEGERTEKNYFEDSRFGAEPRKDNKKPMINRGKKGGTDPQSMLEWAEREAKGMKKGDIVWIVIDKDKNTPEKLRELKDRCEEKGFRLALSNPCFEYWLALHFEYIDTNNIDAEFLNRCLSNNIGCRYNKRECYNGKLHPYTDDAVRNAQRARKDIDEEDRCEHNPFTNMDRLIEDIRRYFESGH